MNWINLNIFLGSYLTSGLEISQNNICGGECDSCKFELNKNTLIFSIAVFGSYFRILSDMTPFCY